MSMTENFDGMAELIANEDRRSANQIIEDTLRIYGLQSLTTFVNNMVFDEDILDQNILFGRIRETDQYKQRFSGNEARRRAGLNTLSEPEYLSQENRYRQLFRNSGLPSQMFNDKDITDRLISNDVSPEEVAGRIQNAYEAVSNADPVVLQEMRRLYNIDDGGLAAYFLDPERSRPILETQARAAQIAGAAAQSGMGIGVGTAEELARRGITGQQAQAGFQAIETGQEIFGLTTEEAQAGEQAFGQQEQIGAVFGTSAAAQQRLRQRGRRRQASFEQGGRFAGQGAEITGLQ
jgi:hypothetical protein